MGLQLYDLAGADPERRFSPYCWRTKFALAHKGLVAKTIPWRFTDKDVIVFSGQGRVPVLLDGDHCISDSWAIAVYLDGAYPDRPSLFGGPSAMAATRLINAWADGLAPMVAPLIATDILAHLHEKDCRYFRETRERRFGMTLEAASSDRDIKVGEFRRSLEPARVVLAAQPYFGGHTPAYADYIVFSLFQWARCISTFRLLCEDDPMVAWRERLLSLFDGLAGKALGYPV
jgi:glutathione S-transferase